MKLYQSIIIALLLFFSLNVEGQIITTIAGNGISASIGDGGPATAARLTAACGGIFDIFGNYYFNEGPGNRVRKITPMGIMEAAIGTGALGFSGDSGPATMAKLRNPKNTTSDKFGNLYVGDVANYRIRKIDAITGIITTIAGNSISGYSGDNGPASAASLGGPVGLCIDHIGNIYLSDMTYSVIRKIDTDGIITTIAGTAGYIGITGDGGQATAAKLAAINMLQCDTYGNVYMVGFNVRKIDVTTGIITKIAGLDTVGFSGDGGLAINAALYSPVAIGFDNYGLLYIADTKNNRIRKIDASGIIHTVVGTGIQGFSGDSSDAINAKLYWPEGIAFDTCNNLYFNDLGNNRIRKVTYNPECWPVAIKDAAIENLSIFPTPATDMLYITGIKETTTYTLYEMTGRAVMCGVLLPKENEINISDVATGMYLLQVQYKSGEREIRKIVKE